MACAPPEVAECKLPLSDAELSSALAGLAGLRDGPETRTLVAALTPKARGERGRTH